MSGVCDVLTNVLTQLENFALFVCGVCVMHFPSSCCRTLHSNALAALPRVLMQNCSSLEIVWVEHCATVALLI